MANSMNNWLGFSLSPQEIPSQPEDHSQTSSVPRLVFNSEGLSATDISGECFDLSSDSTLPSLNLPPPFGILEAFNRNNQSPDWSMKDVNMNSSINYKTSSGISHVLMGNSCNNNQSLGNQEPKLENFLGVGRSGNSFTDQGCNNNQLGSEGDYIYSNGSDNNGGGGGGGAGGNNTIGLSMIKNWLRNNPTPPSQVENKNENGSDLVVGSNLNNGSCFSTAQNLSLSMSTGNSQSTSALPLLTASSDGDGGGGESSTSETKQPISGMSLDSQTAGAIEAVPRKSIDTFGQRTSIYRGVTRHRWTGRYEAHLWDNSCRREGQTRKGRQVYLGGYDKEEKAARAYDLAALKYWGTTTTTNFPISNYEKELEEMKHMTRQEYVASLRRKSSGFSRGASIYRGVTRHHQHGRWQARIGRVAGNKDLYLGTFSTQEEAAEAYDIAAIKFRGLNAVTNFEISRYDVKSILESSTLPIGGAAKRLKEAEQAEMALEAQRASDRDNLSSHLTDEIISSYGAHHANWPIALAFQQAHQPLGIHYPAYNHQQRLWCKQEQDSEVYQDIHQISQMGNNTHNFLQPASVLHNLMSLDSSSLEHSSGSNSVIYSNGGGSTGNVTYQGLSYGNNCTGYVLPMGATVIADHEGNQNQNGVLLENDQGKQIGYENMFSASDYPYQTRNNMYYHNSQQSSSKGTVKIAGVYDQGSSCNNWVPTAVPTIAARTSNVAVCHGGSSTFTVWNDT